MWDLLDVNENSIKQIIILAFIFASVLVVRILATAAGIGMKELNPVSITTCCSLLSPPHDVSAQMNVNTFAVPVPAHISTSHACVSERGSE